MNHSFNVEIAVKYGVEKAILLENFYFWCKKNKANKKSIRDGKAYTYNTSEAFEELFPYMKARKIAQLLREMEEDGLIISGQFGKYDRTKSYTLSDIALSFFEHSNIQNFDNGTSKNCMIENQENVSCLNSDVNADVNTDIKSHKAKNKKSELFDMVSSFTENETLRKLLSSWLKERLLDSRMSKDILELNLSRLKQYGNGDEQKMINKVSERLSAGHRALIYDNDLKEKNNGHKERQTQYSMAYDDTVNHDYSAKNNIVRDENGEIVEIGF